MAQIRHFYDYDIDYMYLKREKVLESDWSVLWMPLIMMAVV